MTAAAEVFAYGLTALLLALGVGHIVATVAAAWRRHHETVAQAQARARAEAAYTVAVEAAKNRHPSRRGK